MIVKRGEVYHLRIRPFGKGKVVTVRTPATGKLEAQRIERSVLVACQSGNYTLLDDRARAVCVRIFQNQGWDMPTALSGVEADVAALRLPDRITLWEAIETFLGYPGIKEAQDRERHIYSLNHVIREWGADRLVKAVWIPDIKLYQTRRLSQGAAPGTVNREVATISKLFTVLMEMQIVESNPARLAKRLSTKSGERQVYISAVDFSRIVDLLPAWVQPIVLTAYYTGMRRGEALGLTRKNVKLRERLIVLSPDETKEKDWKRIPIHQDLAPIFETVLRVPNISTLNLFLIDGRPPSPESVKNPWRKACKALGLDDPRPRFHDLRHTWKTNARRSGMDPEIRESILGHWFKEKSVSERYGRISDAELIQAIDAMTFDHGKTEIWAESRKSRANDGERKNQEVPVKANFLI